MYVIVNLRYRRFDTCLREGLDKRGILNLKSSPLEVFYVLMSCFFSTGFNGVGFIFICIFICVHIFGTNVIA